MAKRTTSRTKAKAPPKADPQISPSAAETGGLRDDDRARLKALVAARRKKARAEEKARSAETQQQAEPAGPVNKRPATATTSSGKAADTASPPLPHPAPERERKPADDRQDHPSGWRLTLHRLLLDRLGHNPERIPTASRSVPEVPGADAPDRPCPRKLINWALDLLPDGAKGYAFVDIATGRGRAVFEASRRPFDRIVGVEKDVALYEDAMLNLRHWPRSIMACRDVEFVNADAARWELPNADLVVHIFAPLDAKDMLSLARHLNKRAEDGGRIVVIYINPTLDLALRESPYFHLIEPAGPAARKIRWFSPYAIEIFSTVRKKQPPPRSLSSIRRRLGNRS